MIKITQEQIKDIAQELFTQIDRPKDEIVAYFAKFAKGLSDIDPVWVKDVEVKELEVHKDILTFLDDVLTIQVTPHLNLLEVLITEGYLKHFQKKYCPQGPIVFHDRTIVAYDESKAIKERVFIETSYSTTGKDQADLVEIYIQRPREYDKDHTCPALYIADPYFMDCNEIAFKPQSLHGIDEVLAEPVKDFQLKSWSKKVDRRPLKDPVDKLEEVVEHRWKTVNPALERYVAKGFALIYYAGRGAFYSQGFNLTGSVEELDAVDATLRWIDGSGSAYYDLEAEERVLPSWSNGSVIMTGKSYLGTLAIGTATYSKSPALKGIIPEAGISSWYDYYRYNNLVVAPQGFPGEDIDILSWFCESFLLNPSNATHKRKERFFELFKQMTHDMDRGSGHYNEFWDERNYLNNGSKVTVPMLIIHGTNDWNVKISHLFKFLKATKDTPSCRNFVIHRGKHIYIQPANNFNLLDLVDRWLDYYFFGLGQRPLENGQGYVQHSYDPNKWELVNFDNRLTQLAYSKEEKVLNWTEELPKDTLKREEAFESRVHFDSAADWEKQVLAENSPLAAHFLSQTLDKDLHIHGDLILNIKAKISPNKGAISCLLVDKGRSKIVDERTNKTGKSNRVALKTDLAESTFVLEREAKDYHVITRGWMNVETPTKGPDQDGYADYSIDMVPTDYTIPSGHQLLLIVCGNDFLYTLHPKENRSYHIRTDSMTLSLDLLK